MDFDLFVDLVQKGGNVAMMALAIVSYATFQAARKIMLSLDKINENLVELKKANQRELSQLVNAIHKLNGSIGVMNVDTKTILALVRRS
jgi:mevalonate kinase